MKRTMSGLVFGLIFFVVVGLMIPKDAGIVAIGISLAVAFAAGFIIGDTRYVSEHLSSFIRHIDERRRKEDAEFASYKKQEKEEKMKQSHRVDVLRHGEQQHLNMEPNSDYLDTMLR